jgi:hypothetical protein
MLAPCVVCCVGNSLCDGLMAHSDECYRFCVCMCVLIVCDLETSTMRQPRPELGCCTPQKMLVDIELESVLFENRVSVLL